MACGSCGGGVKRVTRYRVTLNDGSVQDYVTKADADAARTRQGATKPVRPVSVAITAPTAAPTTAAPSGS